MIVENVLRTRIMPWMLVILILYSSVEDSRRARSTRNLVKIFPFNYTWYFRQFLTSIDCIIHTYIHAYMHTYVRFSNFHNSLKYSHQCFGKLLFIHLISIVSNKGTTWPILLIGAWDAYTSRYCFSDHDHEIYKNIEQYAT